MIEKSLELDEIDSVVLLSDSYQLVLGRHTINVYNSPWISTRESVIKDQDDGFLPALRGLIRKRVISVDITANEVYNINLSDQTAVSISLLPDDYTGPEALVIFGEKEWTVVRSDSFDH